MIESPNNVAKQVPELPPQPVIRVRAAWLVRRAITAVLASFGLFVVIGAALVWFVSIDVTIQAAGILRPSQVWSLRSELPGRVREVLVTPGQSVRKGQVVARLDSRRAEEEVAQLRAEYRARTLDADRATAATPFELHQRRGAVLAASARRIRAEAALRNEFVNFGLPVNADSIRAAYRPGVHVSVDRAMADVIDATADSIGAAAALELTRLNAIDRARRAAELRSMQFQIANRERALEKYTLQAPGDGVVNSEAVEWLEGATVGEGDLILRISQPDAWRVDLRVPQEDVHRIEIGNPARLEVIALAATGRLELQGRVTSVAAEPADADASQAFGSSGEKFYRVTIAVDNTRLAMLRYGQIRPGYVVRGTVIVGRGRILEVLWRRFLAQ